MLLVIFLVLLLAFVQALLPGYYLTKQVGRDDQVGARDNLPEPSIPLARSRRALGNLHETLPIFLTLAVLTIVVGEKGWLPLLGAWVFLLARVAHVVCYMRALSPWRSIAFAVAVLGLAGMGLALVPYLGRI